MKTPEFLAQTLKAKIKSNTLVLPTLPDSAIRVRKAVDDPNCTVEKLAEIIGTDSGLSSRLIKMSNSALMGRAIKVTTVTQAVQRIGLIKIKNIVTAMAMEQLFVTRNKDAEMVINRVWDLTVEIVSSTIAIYEMFRAENPETKLDRDTLMLGALVLNVGALSIIKECEPYPEVFTGGFIPTAIRRIGPIITLQILNSWNFDQEIIDMVSSWRTKEHLSENKTYSDLITISASSMELLPNSESILEQAQKYFIPVPNLPVDATYLSIKQASYHVFK